MIQESSRLDLSARIKKITDHIFYDATAYLGGGSYGDVYKGYDSQENKIMACKIIGMKKWKMYSDMVQREKLILMKISEKPHPNIMGFYGYTEIKTVGICFFLEYCSKNKLQNHIEKGESLKSSQLTTLKMAYQICLGMDHLNKNLGEERYFHRDLKPQNIFLDQEENIKIGDFGCAKEFHSDIQRTQYIGSHEYRAPQVVNQNYYNLKCDVWSAGIIVHELLTGKKPFSDVEQFYSKMQKGHQIQIAEQKRLEPFWDELLNRMLVYDQEKRMTFSELKAFIEQRKEKVEQKIEAKYLIHSYPKQSLASSMLSSVSPACPLRSSSLTTNKSVHYLDSIIKLMNQQQTYKQLNYCRRYLKFILQIAEIYICPISIFNENKKIFQWKNPYKYMLMTLSLAAYITKLLKLHAQIKNKSIETKYVGTFNLQTITGESFQKQFFQILKQFEVQVRKGIEKFKRVISEQIIVHISNYIQQGRHINQLNSHPQVLNYIKEIKKNYWRTQEEYLNEYRCIINNIEMRRPMHIIRQYNRKDLHSFYLIKLIGYTSYVFPEINCHHQDFINRKKQEIQNSSHQALLESIMNLN